MLNQASIDAVAAARTDGHRGLPLYDTYGFAQLPSMIRSLFDDTPTGMPSSVLDSGDRPRAVVLFLLDGFGWSLFERFADDLPFLKLVLAGGVVSKLTSQFPTTTAPHVTTLHTGAPVGASGVFEWFYFEPLLGEIFSPLRCEAIGPDRLISCDEVPAALYPTSTLYQALAQSDIRPFCYQSEAYMHSRFSETVLVGAHRVPFRTLPEAMVRLVDHVTACTAPSYHCVYVDVIDSIAHRYGPNSDHVTAEVRSLFRLLEDEVGTRFSGTDVLLLLTADHGQTRVDPTRTLYVDDALASLPDWLETTADGRPLAPAGGPRDLFLYVKEEFVDMARAALVEAAGGRATVHRTEELVRGGFFGDVQERLRERLSSLVVLPRPGETVWWSGGGRFVHDQRGHHGGLSPEELEIPLLVWRP